MATVQHFGTEEGRRELLGTEEQAKAFDEKRTLRLPRQPDTAGPGSIALYNPGASNVFAIRCRLKPGYPLVLIKSEEENKKEITAVTDVRVWTLCEGKPVEFNIPRQNVSVLLPPFRVGDMVTDANRAISGVGRVTEISDDHIQLMVRFEFVQPGTASLLTQDRRLFALGLLPHRPAEEARELQTERAARFAIASVVTEACNPFDLSLFQRVSEEDISALLEKADLLGKTRSRADDLPEAASRLIREIFSGNDEQAREMLVDGIKGIADETEVLTGTRPPNAVVGLGLERALYNLDRRKQLLRVYGEQLLWRGVRQFPATAFKNTVGSMPLLMAEVLVNTRPALSIAHALKALQSELTLEERVKTVDAISDLALETNYFLSDFSEWLVKESVSLTGQGTAELFVTLRKKFPRKLTKAEERAKEQADVETFEAMMRDY